MKLFRYSLIILSLFLFSGGAFAALLAPFKDELFAYPAVIAQSSSGRLITVDYQSRRDINQRDEIAEQRVKGSYIDLSVRRSQKNSTLRMAGGNVTYASVGVTENARFIVLYLHGQGGNRNQGMNDYTFGGNFNRIKNLTSKNHGLYLTVDFTDFGATGEGQIAALLSSYKERSPKAKIYIACGSMGGALCWRIANNSKIVPRLGGLSLLGSHWDEAFLSSLAFHRNVPVFFGHGSADRVFSIEKQEAFFRKVFSRNPHYPARFVRFETGSHGTPIRMVDWRDKLNWMSAF